MDDIDPELCRRLLTEQGFADREPPQHYDHGYGQWWVSGMGRPVFVQWNAETGKVKAIPFFRFLNHLGRLSGRC